MLRKHLPLFVFLFLLAGLRPVAADNLAEVKKTLKQTFEFATAAYRSGNYAQAKALYEKALRIFPNFAPAHYYLGLVLKQLGASQEAITHLEKCVAIQPNYELAHQELGKLYYAEGNFDAAEKHSLKALKINPQDVSAELSLGWIYLMGKSQPYDAISYFESAVQKQKIPYAYLGLGLAYSMTDQRAKVLEMITRLRQTGKEELAQQLEAMIRDPSLIPKTIPGEPLFASAAHRVEERTPPPQRYPTVTGDKQFEQMPVRLSAPILPSSNVPPKVPPAVSAEERIKELQARQKAQGLSY